MRQMILYFMASLMTSPALACVDIPGAVYDQIPSPDMVMVIAEVTDVSIVPVGQSGSCMTLSYRSSEVLFGEIGDSFRVETCYPDVSADLIDLGTSSELYGFTKGATVVVAVIKAASDSGDLRYAVPNCWGPKHMRLDTMAEAERKEFLIEIKQWLMLSAIGQMFPD
ncbi:hypothetical protein [Tabrizicola sp.]|uniref:hypothetical protein n=1 Tax=Tabrizicola sp. TaxID=2005166 RepID=UPI003F35C7A2